ncbi:MAG: hypothetical protein RIS82_717 [Actinomycetota bacterium]
MRSVNFKNDRGSTMVEFIILGVLLQALVLTAGLGLIAMQHKQLAAEAMARHALRSLLLHRVPMAVTADDLAQQFRISESYQLQLECSDTCTTPGDIAVLKVSIGQVSAEASMVVPQ